MGPVIQAELDRQQSSMLEKLSSIIDNKLDSMKRQLDETSNIQMSELKKIRLTEPRTFKKKGYEQQYKHNQQVKSVVSEAKDAVTSGRQDTCIAKLNEGIELIDQRQKLILIADKSEYGWKIVGEYLDNELADNDQDAKKMKKAENEAQRKLAETRGSKAAKARSSSFKSPRAVGSTAISPLQSSFAFPSGNYTSRFTPSVGGTRNIGPFVGGPAQKRGTCFSCGKPGHWRNKCPLLVVAQAQPDGKKLSNHFIDLCDSESISVSNDLYDAFEHVSEIDNRTNSPVEKGDFLERECRSDSVRGRLKTYILAWEELEPTEAVLSVIREGYKLPLHTIPEFCVLRNNKSAFDNNDFVTEALNDLLATQCISVVESQPWVVNPLTVSTRDDGKRRLVLDLRHVNPHFSSINLNVKTLLQPRIY